MKELLEIIGALLVLGGSLFLLLASLGLVRMPDVYNRMQAGTKATTLGSIMIFMGLGFFYPQAIPKLVVLILFVFLTNPLSSHALARSAHYRGISPILPKYAKAGSRDDLATAREKGAQQ